MKMVPAVAVLFVSVALLSACTATASGGTPPSSSAAATPDPTATAAGDPATPPAAPPTSAPVDDAAGDATVDQLYIEMNGAAVCESHQDVLIALPQTNVSLTGDCGTIRITADFVTLTADSAAVLSVEGDSNTATLGTAGEVDTPGAENTITWTTGAAGANDTGESNNFVH
jgi:hypothetical protein